jgi:V8-like Glu-specific endopeptidase
LLLLIGVVSGFALHGYLSASPAAGSAMPTSTAAGRTAQPEAALAVDSSVETFVPPVTGSLLTAAPEEHSPAPPEPEPVQSVEDVVATALPAVASIDAGNSRGSGFFVRHDIVVTNAHVVAGRSQVQLQADGRAYTARVVTTSPGYDLALLQVSGARPDQATLPLGAGLGARPGEEVVAIGYALGSLSNTVTRGIVSAIRQDGAVSLLQTDAAINPGNSGGPLLDRRGRVVGINSMSISKQVGEGLGFAIAAEHVSRLLEGQNPSVTGTPLTRLNETIERSPDSDDQRAQETARLESFFQSIDRSGQQLDMAWNSGARVCVAGTSSTQAARPWFALWEINGVRLASASGYNCTGWLDSMRGDALTLRGAVLSATESARRGGVYPGTIRELRRKYRLDWDGWDR